MVPYTGTAAGVRQAIVIFIMDLLEFQQKGVQGHYEDEVLIWRHGGVPSKVVATKRRVKRQRLFIKRFYKTRSLCFAQSKGFGMLPNEHF